MDDRKTILIVDDNAEILEFVGDVLGQEYHVIPVSSAVNALELLQRMIVHLVISDVMMPEMSGFAFCERIKADHSRCHIPVILLTAKKTLNARVEGLELGADAYIDKPFSPKHLKAQVRSLINNRNMIRQYFSSSPLVNIRPAATDKSNEQFMLALGACIRDHLDDPRLDGDFLADEMCLSRTSLYRKVKAISEQTVHEMINLARLKRAAELLAVGSYRVFEVSNSTGFSSPNHFIRVFSRHFGISPAAYIKQCKESRA